MKCTKVILGGLIAGVAMVNAMPTLEQAKKVEPLVMGLMREDENALKNGKKTRAEVAQSAMEFADKAESEAVKLLLMKGALNLYVRAGEFDKAIATLHSLKAAITDIPPQIVTNMIETALRGAAKKEDGELFHKLIDEYKADIASRGASSMVVEERNSIASILKGMIKVPGRDYWLSATELTQGQWESVMGYNPSSHKGANLPVENVSRDDCDIFLKKLNATKEVQASQFEFRLPELHEWKYAAWAGSAGRGSWIKPGVAGDVLDMAWVRANSLNQTHVVATKAPNAFGFYDMLGNVWEWLAKEGGDAPRGCGSLKGCAFNQVADKCTWNQNWHMPKNQRNCCVGLRLAAHVRQQRGLLGHRLLRPQEGMLHRATVDGYTWSYRVIDGEAMIVSTNNQCVISPRPTGKISIPSVLGGAKVTRIGNNAFNGCRKLVSVVIPMGVTIIGNDAFANCAELKSATIPSSVKNIDSYAFSNCVSLQSIVIPEGVESIGSEIFARYCGVETVSLPSTVTNIEPTAFIDCKKLRSFHVAPANPCYRSINGLLCSKDGSYLVAGVNGDVMIPEGVTTIGRGAFHGCFGLNTVLIPSSVTNIEHWAFSFLPGLSSVRVDTDNPAYKSVDGLLLTKDGRTLIRGVNGKVTIPAGVECIGEVAFSCSRLESLTIPEGVTNIEHAAFYRCGGMQTVAIPSSVKTIRGGGAFALCGDLTSVTILGERPNAPNSIFEYCGRLKSIHVPANAKSWAGMKKWHGIPLVFDAGVGETFSLNAAPGSVKELDLGNVPPLQFVYCPAGKFSMGYKKQPAVSKVKDVEITSPFWVSKTMISVDQLASLGLNSITNARIGAAAIDDVSIVVQKLPSVLKERFGKMLPPGYVFRLPTEAEFEYLQKAEAKKKNAKTNIWGVERLYSGGIIVLLDRAPTYGKGDVVNNVSNGTSWTDLVKVNYENQPDKDPVGWSDDPNWRVFRRGLDRNGCRKLTTTQRGGLMTNNGFYFVVAPDVGKLNKFYWK